MDSAFLHALFERAEGQHAYLWKLPERVTHWFPCDAIPDTLPFTDANDVYVGVALASKAGTVKERVKADNVSGIIGLWIDIDYLDPDANEQVHKKTNLPRDGAAALDIVAAMPLTPTYTIHSGHGYQCWWLFAEPWTFDSPQERTEAATLARRWLLTLRAVAREFGVTLDSVFDLSRVMRVPGTMNAKGALAAAVTVHEETGIRYQPSDFAIYLVDDMPEASIANVAVSEVDANATPPMAKFMALYTNDSTFKNLYEHKKKPRNDDSPSGYDLALANVAVRAGWTDEEVLALLIRHRLDRYKEMPKHKRYYEMTLGKARAAYVSEAAVNTLHDAEPEADQSDVWESVSGSLGVGITGLIEYPGANPTYRLLTSEGDSYLGEANNLANQSNFRTKVLAATGILPTPLKPATWTKVVNLMMRVRVRENVGEDASELGRIRDWLVTYLRHRTAIVDNVEGAVSGRAPLIYQGYVYIFSRDFQMWIRDNLGERVTMQDMLAMLSHLGVVPEKLNYLNTIMQRRTSTEARRLPVAEFDPQNYMPRE